MHLDHDVSDPAAPTISFDQFLAVDIRIGTIVKAEPFPEARNPAYKLSIDFGPTLGTTRSSAQISPAGSVGFPRLNGQSRLCAETPRPASP
jgi:tRNA-binding protein